MSMVGHNSNGELSEDQLQALGYHHKGKFEAALAAKKAADAAFKTTCKRAVADGVSVDDIKLLIRLDTPEGEAALRDELRRTLRVAGWSNSEIGTQFTFDDIPDRSPLVDRALAEGKKAGMEGQTPNPPYEGEAGQAWLEAWHQGQEAIFSVRELSEARAAAGDASANEEGEQENEPAPKKRGRPKGSGKKASPDNGAAEAAPAFAG